jgi:hypothetical protein
MSFDAPSSHVQFRTDAGKMDCAQLAQKRHNSLGSCVPKSDGVRAHQESQFTFSILSRLVTKILEEHPELLPDMSVNILTDCCPQEVILAWSCASPAEILGLSAATVMNLDNK